MPMARIKDIYIGFDALKALVSMIKYGYRDPSTDTELYAKLITDQSSDTEYTYVQIPSGLGIRTSTDTEAIRIKSTDSESYAK